MSTLEIIQHLQTLEIVSPAPAVLEVRTEVLELLEVARQGPPGTPGKSAYQLWLEVGNVGTLEQFQAQLSGPEYASVRNKPHTFPPSPHTHTSSDVTDLEPPIDLVLLFENALE